MNGYAPFFRPFSGCFKPVFTPNWVDNHRCEVGGHAPLYPPIDVRIKKFDGRTAEWALYSRKDVFGLDLYEAGLGDRIEGFVRELFAGKGAVRKTLHKYVVRR